MITAILVFLLFVFLILYVIVNEARPHNYPPGPPWWPLLGNGFEVRRLSKKLKGHYLALTELAKEHDTSILGLKLGRDLVVVGSSLEVIRAIFTRDVFTGRPTSFFMKLRCFGERRGITSVDGYLWKAARTFTVRHLKQFGYGKEAMERLIEDEVRELIQFLKKEETVDNFGDATAPSVLNVLWALATGKRLEKSDPRLKKLLKLLNRRAQAFDMAGGTLNQMPWLRFIAPEKTGYSLLEELNSQLKEFLMDTVTEQKKSYNPDETRSLIDAFLHERAKNRNDFSYSDDQLIVLLLDLLLGGAQTTSRTLDFAVLLMLKNPEVQEKVHRNIVEVIGRSQLLWNEIESSESLARS